MPRLNSIATQPWTRGFDALVARAQATFPRDLISLDALNRSLLSDLYRSPSHKKPVDVLLTGGFVARLLSAGQWPEGSYRIWVGCERSRKVLSHVTGAKAGEIGVLPRYRLYPLQKTLKAWSDSPTFVYGGRLTPMKGLWHLIEIVSELQSSHGLSARLHLSGEWCGSYKGSFSSKGIEADEVEERTMKLISSLPWSEAPIIRTGLPNGKWIPRKIENPVIASLSQSTHEDFGVSVAEGQALGWPSFLSSWGAHFDARLPNTVMAPRFHLYSSPSQRTHDCRKMAQALAQHITNEPERFHFKPPTAFSKVEVVDGPTLSKWLKKSESRYPGLVRACESGGLSDFSRSKSGRAFVQMYESIFSGAR